MEISLMGQRQHVCLMAKIRTTIQAALLQDLLANSYGFIPECQISRLWCQLTNVQGNAIPSMVRGNWGPSGRAG